jgi:hypothetical protein
MAGRGLITSSWAPPSASSSRASRRPRQSSTASSTSASPPAPEQEGLTSARTSYSVHGVFVGELVVGDGPGDRGHGLGRAHWDYAEPYRQKIVPYPNVHLSFGGRADVNDVCSGHRLTVLEGRDHVFGVAFGRADRQGHGRDQGRTPRRQAPSASWASPHHHHATPPRQTTTRSSRRCRSRRPAAGPCAPGQKGQSWLRRVCSSILASTNNSKVSSRTSALISGGSLPPEFVMSMSSRIVWTYLRRSTAPW